MPSVSDEPTRSVDLPSSLVERVETRLPRTTWETPDEYIASVVMDVLTHVEGDADHDVEPVDERAERDRLESLGYIQG